MEGGDRVSSLIRIEPNPNESDQFPWASNSQSNYDESNVQYNVDGNAAPVGQQIGQAASMQYFLSPSPSFDSIFDDLLEGGTRSGASNSGEVPADSKEASDEEVTRKMVYLNELLRDEKWLNKSPDFLHLRPLLDREIERVRKELCMKKEELDFFKQSSTNTNAYFCGKFKLEPIEEMPPPNGPILTIVEKVYPPVAYYPGFNFIGRLVGPRGETIKRLEQICGCQITIRGRGSEKDTQLEEHMRCHPGFEHLKETLHVRVVATDHKERAVFKVKRAKRLIEQLLIPVDGDELKENQLRELSRIRYRNRRHKHSAVTAPIAPILYPSVLSIPQLDSAAPSEPFAVAGPSEPFSVAAPMLNSLYYVDPSMTDANGSGGFMTMLWPHSNAY